MTRALAVRAGRVRVGWWEGIGLAGALCLAVAGQGLTIAPPGLAGAAARVGVTGGTAAGSAGGGPYPWWFGLPRSWTAGAGGHDLLTAAFYAGIAALALAWAGLGARVIAGPPVPLRRLRQVAALWAAPLLVAPVVLSSDMFTYLGQGGVAHLGLDPYLLGPGLALHPGPLLASVPRVWRTTPAPYGPAFLALTAVLSGVAPHHMVAAVLGIRALDGVGLVLLAWSLPRLARANGGDPARATWLGLCSPLVLLAYVLSGHNGALMVGLLAAGLALAAGSDRRQPAALAVCTLAAMVKAPAAAGVVVLGLAWARRGADRRQVGRRLALGAAAVASTAVAVTLACGLGWRWLSPAVLVGTPTTVHTWLTPVSVLATPAAWLLTHLGIASSPAGLLGWARLAGGAVALVWGALLVWKAPALGTTLATGLLLLGVVVASPVVWPWYLAWGLALLATTRAGQRSRALAALGSGALFLCLRPDGDLITSGHWYITLAMGIACAALALAAARWVPRVLGSEDVDGGDRPDAQHHAPDHEGARDGTEVPAVL